MREVIYGAAIFDMDGLLLDSERVVRDAWMQVARERRVELTDADYLQVVGRNAADARALLSRVFSSGFDFEDAQRSVDALLAERKGEAFFPPKPGAAALLGCLRALGVRCGVASSTRVEEVRRRLDGAALLPFFASICGGDEVARGKPSPDLFLLASERIGVAPRHCLVFEDSEHGARGALAAGMSAVIVPDLKTPDGALRDLCVAVLKSLEEALPSCERWFAAR